MITIVFVLLCVKRLRTIEMRCTIVKIETKIRVRLIFGITPLFHFILYLFHKETIEYLLYPMESKYLRRNFVKR